MNFERGGNRTDLEFYIGLHFKKFIKVVMYVCLRLAFLFPAYTFLYLATEIVKSVHSRRFQSVGTVSTKDTVVNNYGTF